MRISKKVIITIGLFLFIGSFVGTVVLLTGCSGGGGNNSINGKKETLTLDDDLEYIEPVGMPTPEETLSSAAEAIEAGDTEEALKMFYDGSGNKKIKDLLNNFSLEGKKRLALNLKNATLDENWNDDMTLGENNENMKTYKTELYREGGLPPITVHFNMIKLPNGNWVILDL